MWVFGQGGVPYIYIYNMFVHFLEVYRMPIMWWMGLMYGVLTMAYVASERACPGSYVNLSGLLLSWSERYLKVLHRLVPPCPRRTNGWRWAVTRCFF